MNINTPLRTLDIVGTTNSSTCVANQTENLGRGTRDYILSLRNEILENRGYVLPEDFDTNWNIRLGPIWTPDVESRLINWISPEYFRPETNNPTKIIEATDRSPEENNWSQTALGNMPTLGTPLNGFDGLVFDGFTDKMVDDTTDTLNHGTGDFLHYMVVNIGPDDNSETLIVTTKNITTWALTKDCTSSATTLTMYLDSNATSKTSAYSFDDDLILTFGRKANKPILYVNGTLAFEGSADLFNVSSISGHLGDGSGASGNFEGVIYEMVVISDEGAVSTGNIAVYQEEIEGYLAHKYGLTGNLPAAHTYKTNPPRKSVV